MSTAIAAAEPTEAAAAEEKQQPTFQLNELRVLGNTVLDAATIESVLYPYLGEQRSLKDVEVARAALEEKYHSKGYGTVYVDIPEQSIGDDGVVRLHVTEAKLHRARIAGALYFSERQIRNALPAAKEGTVPNLPQLQSQITAVNAVTSDRTVMPVLKAGPLPGTVDLDLKVQDRSPLHASLEFNNQYTADTSPLRALGIVSYDNAFRRFDSVSLQYQMSPQDRSEVDVIAGAYVARLDERGDKLAITYVHSSSDVATVGALGVTGKGSIYSVRFARPLQATSSLTSQFFVSMDYKDFSQDVLVSQTSSLSTPISYASFSAGYNLSVRESSRVWSWSTSGVFGIPGLGGTREKFSDKCFGCKPNFAILRMDGSLQQNIPGGFFALLQLAGQYSADPVISNEQFLLGGVHSVRGYLEAEDLGDVGARGSVEFHVPNYLPTWMPFRVSPFVFYDAGQISYQEPLPSQPSASTLRSWGAGLGMNAWNFLSASLTWADPLVDGSRTRHGDSRWEFVIRAAW